VHVFFLTFLNKPYVYEFRLYLYTLQSHLMKQSLLLALALVFSTALSAQITVTQADYGQAGDSIVVGYDNAPPTGLNVGGTGMQTWDFSTMSLSNINTLSFVDPATTASGAQFPNADLAIERQSDTLFFQSSSSALVVDGFAGAGFGLPINIIADFNPNSTQIEFPSTFNSSFVDTAIFDTTVSCMEFGIAFCDSARLKRIVVATSLVDAYGDISTPGGNFTTIRQYYRADNQDTVWTKLPFIGWSVFLDSVSTEHTYRWIANGEQWPVLSAQANAAGGDILAAEFVIGAQVLGFVENESSASCAGACDGSATVSAVGGLPPYTYAWPGGGSGATQSGLCAGTYVVTISDNDTGTYEVTVEINEPNPVSIAGAVQGVNLGADGAIDINVSGGTGTYTYSWTGPNGFTAVSQDIGNLDAGEYTVVVTDANGCDTSAVFAVELTGIGGPVDGGFKMFPNPANDRVTLASNELITEYIVIDLLGNLVIQGQVNATSIVVSTEDLAAGVCLMKVDTDGGSYLRKFTVRH
jgi:hypothetical protein